MKVTSGAWRQGSLLDSPPRRFEGSACRLGGIAPGTRSSCRSNIGRRGATSARGVGRSETWRAPAGERVRSFAIITTTPNKVCPKLHNCMPDVLKPDTWPEWLGEEPADARQLKAMVAPYPSEEMTCWPVTTRVGNIKNNDPSLVEPIVLP